MLKLLDHKDTLVTTEITYALNFTQARDFTNGSDRFPDGARVVIKYVNGKYVSHEYKKDANRFGDDQLVWVPNPRLGLYLDAAVNELVDRFESQQLVLPPLK